MKGALTKKSMIHHIQVVAVLLANILSLCPSAYSIYSCSDEGKTCCNLASLYNEDSPFKFNLDDLLSKINSSSKDREQSPLVRASQFLSSPNEDPASSLEPVYGAWLCAENQTPDACQACIQGVLTDIWSGFPALTRCERSTGAEVVAPDLKCRVRYEKFQFWNPSDTCQPLCCSAEKIEDGYRWSYGGNLLRAWNRTRQMLKEKANVNHLSYRDFYRSWDNPIMEVVGRQSDVFIGYDCAPWVTGPQCLRCVESLVLSLDRWFFREGERCDDTVGVTANDDHQMYSVNPHQEPGAYAVHGGSGDWPNGPWPRGSCKLFFDNKPHPDSLYAD